MKRFLGALFVALTAGCGARDAQEAPDPNAPRFEQVERRVGQLEGTLAQHAASAEKKTDDTARAAKAELSDLEARHAGSVRRIEALEAAVRDLSAELRAVKQQPAAATPAPAPAAATAPAPATPDFFPVSISDVTGRTVVTGTHLTTRDIETDEIYRDEYGKRAKRTRSEVVEANQYGYQAAFTVENLTDGPVELTVSAGGAPRTVSIPARETLPEVTVDWTPGSALTVTAGGRRERIRIPW